MRIEVRHPSEPSPVSPDERAGLGPAALHHRGRLSRGDRHAYVMLGASDSRHFARICPPVYRFSPFEMSFAERSTLHAVNEHIRVSTWLRGIEFYERLIGAL
ncbi:MAG: hypothetical protein WDM88_05610 [Galbitalea sp.]